MGTLVGDQLARTLRNTTAGDANKETTGRDARRDATGSDTGRDTTTIVRTLVGTRVGRDAAARESSKATNRKNWYRR